jgi:ATP-dependent helicase HepA
MKIGNFVATSSKYSVGKIIKVNENHTIDVKFLVNISLSHTENIEIDNVVKVYLGKQTRVYNYTLDSGWRTGRVVDHEFMDDGSIEYEIKFSGGRTQEWLKEKEIEVRCLLKLDDPTDVLAYSYGESQFLHDARFNILNRMTDLRASVKGLTALSSSSIDLVIYQVNIAKKILSDPIQRYLLSDEVGMGKTIEAGIIARQCLLDSNNSTVLVIVPNHLLLKWKNELRTKFYLDDFDDRIEIITPSQVSPSLENPNLLIIDEAHHIVGNTNKYSQFEKDLILELAKKSEKLLMLTATPGIGNEKVLFNLLKILEPNYYLKVDFDLFKEKLLKQREQGVFLRTLKSTTSTFLLKRNLTNISTLFPNDDVCLNISNEILQLIENEKNFEDNILELKTYIMETWNFNNRLIRTRRIDCEGWEFQPRGEIIDNKCSQEHIHLLISSNNIYENINYQIENWRNQASLFLDSIETSVKNTLEKRYVEILEKSNGTLENFKLFLQKSKDNLLFKEELTLLVNIENSIDDYNYFECINSTCKKILDLLNDISNNSIGVLFVDDRDLAKIICASLLNINGKESALILDDETHENYDLSNAHNTFPKLRILIVDKNYEEGIDLQFADAVIHYDLGFNISRIEQRIGRVDRYGRKRSNTIQHIIVLSSDNENYPWINWFELLVDGFEIFNQPISDIQLKLEDMNNNIYLELLKYGTTSLLNHFKDENIVGTKIDSVREIIIEERKYLDEQYALNHLALSESDSLNLRDIIEIGEDEENSIEEDIDYWLFRVLNFYKQIIDKKRFEIKWNNNTLIPKLQFWSKNNHIITDLWFGKFETSLDRELTYYRNTAVSNEYSSLIRPGHPLFIALQDYLDIEDRGTTFSTYRVVEKDFPIAIPRGGIEIMFKLVFFIDIDFSSFENSFNKNAQMRRCDEYFPPKVFTLYIDEKMNIVENEDIVETLNEPYVKNRLIDTNLSSRTEIIEHFIDKKIYIDLCKDVSLNAKKILKNSDLYKTHIEISIKKANQDIQKRLFKLEQRNRINKSTDTEGLIRFEKNISKLINQYEIKLDSIGMFFLSKYPLDELGLNIE